MMMKWVLGLGGSNHDFSAALLENGSPHTLIEDERLSGHRYGNRHWASSPCKASADYCLENAGIDYDDLDGIFVSNDIEGHNRFWRSSLHTMVGHHLCHAAASYYASPFDQAAILVIDGKGGPISAIEDGKRRFETISTGTGKKNRLHLETIQSGEHHVSISTWRYISSNSIGWFYSIVTECIGMGAEGEGKTMALAAFGTTRFKNRLLEFVSFSEDTPFEMDPYGGLWSYLVDTVAREENSFQVRADLAASAQSVLEDVVLSIARTLRKKTGLKYLTYGGGVALNGVLNHRLREQSGFDDLFVFPASGDNGLSAGAALYGFHHLGENLVGESSLRRSVSFAQCGKTYDDDRVLQAARRYSVSAIQLETTDALIQRMADRLEDDGVIALYQGGSEFGPRALGNRSLIALPGQVDIQKRLNRIKNRESFRPFAPIILEEEAARYFQISGSSPFMLEIAPVRPEFRSALAGAVHVDGSARLQTIAAYQTGLVRPLLLELASRGLPPVILNTSFNLKGEPIVETPDNALKAFLHLNVENLVMGNVWIEKQTPIKPVTI